MVTSIRPASIAELSEAVRAERTLRIVGSGRHAAWRVDPEGPPELSLTGLTGIVELYGVDQVVVVRAGTMLSQLQTELAEVGQTIPYAAFEESDDSTIGGAVSLGLPHRLEGQCGTWREWVLGMTVVRADGTVAKCGSRAVKNVAGYDVARLFTGGRGALGVIAEVILRTTPLKSVPAPLCPALGRSEAPLWVQRVPLSLVGQLPSDGVVDPATATAWLPLPAESSLPRIEGDWVVRRGCGAANLPDIQHPALVYRALEIFDPSGKFNPGALGL
jgi:glycolate oxidase FAD binding subunit